MRTIRFAFVLASMLVSQSVFAQPDQIMMSEDGACSAIAKTCIKHGFSRNDHKGKQFWLDCMRPLIMGQSVKGVTVSADTIRTCRDEKIAELKHELSDLEKAS